MEWSRLRSVRRGSFPEIAFALRVGKRGSKRADLSVHFGRPEKAVGAARGAGNLLRVLQHLVAIAVAAGVFALGVDIGADDAQGVEFIASNAPIQDLVAASRRVEA